MALELYEELTTANLRPLFTDGQPSEASQAKDIGC